MSVPTISSLITGHLAVLLGVLFDCLKLLLNLFQSAFTRVELFHESFSDVHAISDLPFSICVPFVAPFAGHSFVVGHLNLSSLNGLKRAKNGLKLGVRHAKNSVRLECVLHRVFIQTRFVSVHPLFEFVQFLTDNLLQNRVSSSWWEYPLLARPLLGGNMLLLVGVSSSSEE